MLHPGLAFTPLIMLVMRPQARSRLGVGSSGVVDASAGAGEKPRPGGGVGVVRGGPRGSYVGPG